MFVIKVRRRTESDEELRTCQRTHMRLVGTRERENHINGVRRRTVGVRARVGHGKDTSAGEPQFGMYLVFACAVYQPAERIVDGIGTYNRCPYILVPPRPVPVGSPP